MADTARTPHSGNDWPKNHLAAYNISVVEQFLPKFFQTPANAATPPLPASLDTVSTTEDRDRAPDDYTYKLHRHLDFA
jgi:hypothetical protein